MADNKTRCKLSGSIVATTDAMVLVVALQEYCYTINGNHSIKDKY